MISTTRIGCLDRRNLRKRRRAVFLLDIQRDMAVRVGVGVATPIATC